MTTFEYSDAPFKCIREEINVLQSQYVWMKHITRGVSKALDNCRLKNILWELAKKTYCSKVKALETEKAKRAAQVGAMTMKLADKIEEIRRYHAEQTVVLNWVRDLVGNPNEVVNKAAHKFMEAEEPSSARQTLQNLVKYSRTMKELLTEIHKLLSPCGAPRSSTTTIFEVVGEVKFVPTSQAEAIPSRITEHAKQKSLVRIPKREKTLEWSKSPAPE